MSDNYEFYKKILVLVVLSYVVSSEEFTHPIPVIFTNCTTDNIEQYEHYEVEPSILIATDCTLGDVPNSLFVRFLTVKGVELENAGISSIQDYALNGLRQLNFLKLNENNLTELKSWSDHSFELLESVDLSRNIIEAIRVDALRRYPNLINLNLSKNRISRLPLLLFVYTPFIQTLNLDNNRLQSIDATIFKELKDLTTLTLHSNSIKFVDPFSFSANQRLKSLRLDNNQLKVYDSLLGYTLPRLHYLNLSNNQLADIGERTFQKNLELKVLDLSHNQLLDVKNDAFAGLQTLQMLNISNNNLDVLLPISLREFEKLKILDISSNRLEYLFNGVMDNLIELEELNLFNNTIDEIEPNVFQQQKQLHTLNLGYNRLTDDRFLDNMPALRFLHMDHNRFDKLNLTLLFALTSADLIGNPWKCSWLIVEMMRASDGFQFGKNYSIATQDLVLTVPGIDCTDDIGNNRSIVMLQASDKNRNYGKIIAEETNPTIRTRSFNRILNDEFDYKACLIWTAIGIIVVFGSVQIGKICLRKSEKKSEELRLKQQVSLLNTPSTANSGKYRNTHVIFSSIRDRDR